MVTQGLVRYSLSGDSSCNFACWGAAVRGDEHACTPDFTASGTRFVDKFCSNCRSHGISVDAARCRTFMPGSKSEMELLSLLSNANHASGFWKALSQAGRTSAIPYHSALTRIMALPIPRLHCVRSMRMPDREQHQVVSTSEGDCLPILSARAQRPVGADPRSLCERWV